MADPVTLTELEESNNKQLTTALYLILQYIVTTSFTQLAPKDQ
jgi:hypothetical protein